MSRPNPFVLFLILLLFAIVFGGAALLKGGLFLDAHEGDSYHMLDILLRIDMGLRPHQDFSTPLGFLAFLPISTFIEAGHSAGKAVILAQLGVAAVLFPFVFYASMTRFSRHLAWMFGILTLGLVLSLNFGSGSNAVSISMHYNRWAWAISFVALALAVIPSRHERPVIDGALIGILGATLVLLKVTYFVAFAPGVLVAIFMRWHRAGFLAALAGGFAVAIAATALQGFAFWPAYLNDLAQIPGSEVRPFAGVDLATSIAGPEFMGATAFGIAAILLVRRSGHNAAASAVFLLVPGFIYVTYQNFGNDPQWIWFLGLAVFALRPEAGVAQFAGRDLRTIMGSAAWVALALNFPSLFGNATSHITHASLETEGFAPMIPNENGHQDIYVRNDRGNAMTAIVHQDRMDPNWARYSVMASRDPLVEFEGATFPFCEWAAGSRAYMERVAEDLRDDGLNADSQFLLADGLSGLWMFGPFKPLEDGAPWYYGGLTGLENADYLVVPKCVFVAALRDIIINELKAAKVEVSLIRDTDLYALYVVNE